MSSQSQLSELMGACAHHLADARPLLPMYLHLILSALFPIYTGAYASLSRPSSAAKPEKKSGKPSDAADDDDDDEGEEEDTVQKMEGLGPKDAILFPVMAATVLAVLYVLIQKYGKDIINLVLGWYFAGVGVYSVSKLVNDAVGVLVSLIFPDYFAHRGRLWKVNVTQRKMVSQPYGHDAANTANSTSSTALSKEPAGVSRTIWDLRAALKRKYSTTAYIQDVVDFKANLTIINALSAVVGIGAVSYANLIAKPWFLTNLQGFAVCYSAFQLMSPTTFATGSLILGGLFCYDIWAVFFTPLMVTVAKNLDQPIKLLFPRPSQPGQVPGEPPQQSYSMLGLGDIVLPGLMIALALRFDLYLFYLSKQRMVTKVSDEGKDSEKVVDKAQYASVTGRWGDRLWTITLPASARPPQLQIAFPTSYFNASIIGYVSGMVATLGVMSVFQHAQPALLYLVPGVLISLWGTGLVRGELGVMWNFSEAFNGEQVDEQDETALGSSEKEPFSVKSWLLSFWHEIVGDQPARNTDEDRESTVADGKSSNEPSSHLVLFSIQRFKRHKTHADANAQLDSANVPRSQENSEDISVISEVGSEDPVLVSSSGLDGTNDRQLRNRALPKS